MKCSEFKKLIFDYMENELDFKTKNDFKLHVSTCKNCLQDLEEFSKSVELLRQLKEITLPVELDEKIKTRLKS